MRIETEILEAQEFACEYYNITREEFIAKACHKYPLLANTHQFKAAVRSYDQIQQEMMEVA
tara:strand:+ start:497 stop:679 length:183 start_codon:yes stop_codon:yes gene_type:complete